MRTAHTVPLVDQPATGVFEKTIGAAPASAPSPPSATAAATMTASRRRIPDLTCPASPAESPQYRANRYRSDTLRREDSVNSGPRRSAGAPLRGPGPGQGPPEQPLGR